MSSKKYVQNAVATVEELLENDDRELKSKSYSKKHKGPLPTDYKPELDVSEECTPEQSSRFRQIMGIL